MESDFNNNLSIEIELTTDRIEIGSSRRFRYYKTRRNGVLHFVKTLTSEYSADLISLEALRKEFILGYGLNHPNIVRYYTLQENCIFEEYIDGETLKDLLDNNDRRLQEKDFLQSVCRQILEALRYLHGKGILHLDLKPENIMVSRLGNQIKIIDLSCAASAEYDSTPGCTSEYMAPEQTFARAGIPTDLYQVGKVMAKLSGTAGRYKDWRQFVKKATANHLDNRFKTAEEAIKSIPFSNNIYRKWIIAIVACLIVGGIIWVIIGYTNGYEEVKEKERQPAIETEESQSSDTQNQETSVLEETYILQPQNSGSVLPSLPSDLEIEKAITKKIENKLDDLFSLNVSPMYEKMMADESYKNTKGITGEFIDTYSKELDNLIDFGEELKKEYPDKASFIDERVLRSFETRTSIMLLKLFPHNQEMSNNETLR